VSAPHRLGRITPAPTPAEAAAIVAAIERFTRERAPGALPNAGGDGGWLRAARLEAVARAPERAVGTPDRHPWRERARAYPTKH
jgi:hypothetical protein